MGWVWLYWIGLGHSSEYTDWIGWRCPQVDGLDWVWKQPTHDRDRVPYSQPYRLRLEFQNTAGWWSSTEYWSFYLDSEADGYRLHVNGYSGDEANVLLDGTDAADGIKFSAYDSDNDEDPGGNCADFYDGGWWFHSCFYMCLMSNSYHTLNSGIGAFTLTESRMLIKPQQP